MGDATCHAMIALQGKEVVDIREEWREGDPLHSGLAGGGTQLSPTASVASSADWFEDLMQVGCGCWRVCDRLERL